MGRGDPPRYSRQLIFTQLPHTISGKASNRVLSFNKQARGSRFAISDNNAQKQLFAKIFGKPSGN
jgi:hypothetical protein